MSDPQDWSAWSDSIIEANRGVVAEFRSNAGEVGGYFAGAPLLLLHHFGRRTGVERVTPLVYVADQGGFVVAATKGGAPHNPDWYTNLMAHPRVTIEVGSASIQADASAVTGAEREQLYARLCRMRPAFAGYQDRTTRVIPMVRLTPVDGPPG